MKALREWSRRAEGLKVETWALYLAYKDPRAPWFARVLAVTLVAYAFSPIDLIPDFIPVLGYLDDLILLPLGVFLVIRLIPPDVLEECRAQARTTVQAGQVNGKWAALFIVAIWLIATLLLVGWLVQLLA